MLFAQKLLNESTWWVADKNFSKMKTLFLLLLPGLLFYLPNYKVSGVYFFFFFKMGKLVAI